MCAGPAAQTSTTSLLKDKNAEVPQSKQSSLRLHQPSLGASILQEIVCYILPPSTSSTSPQMQKPYDFLHIFTFYFIPWWQRLLILILAH